MTAADRSASPGPDADYDTRLGSILAARDWAALREFSRERNAVPDDVYAQPQHFWEVMLHKLTCSRIDLLALHEQSRTWLAEHGYTPDLGGY
ncbi:MAG: hypothetical protein GIX03_02535 [Candidatus Eremiobacteraeota bacterium]|nr:hypothetical protein [Candidatus Eremiobacteraeota bacterium]MBC5801893.1 hypothetical protein [Candidatus Eremiobacteraeota bacterium]MBC5820826.1 hypothetical protein [Candidatus Eremiobacteraeota bacterium]